MADHSATDLIEKIRTLHISRRGFVTSAAAGALAMRQSWEVRAQEEPEVIYDGGVFDAGGETLRIGSWSGFWEDMERRLILDQMQEEFNCQIAYDGAWPWFPKFVAGGVDNALAVRRCDGTRTELDDGDPC
jgi:putative spermidine/putrescine transport system substrate-binding protein